MTKRYSNCDQNEQLKGNGNSDEDLIRFSAGESGLVDSNKEKICQSHHNFPSGVGAKNKSQHTVSSDVGATTCHQQSLVNTQSRPSRQTHSLTPGQSSSYANRSRHHHRPIDNTTITSASKEYSHGGNGQRKNNLPKHAKYQSYKDRLSTFKHWPRQIKQTKEEMAEAALFYTGKDDLVTCFQCGGKLRDWDANDDVWEEHAILFPLCSYVREHRGAVFVENLMPDWENSLSDMQHELVRCLENVRADILQMGFTDSQFHMTYRHLKNMGIDIPTLNEMIDVLNCLVD